MPKTYSYRGILSYQVDGGLQLVLFAAPAREIERWAGIPQRQVWGDQESVGFQRDLNGSRVTKLAKFYSVPRNTMQNPLLAAMQFREQVTFTPAGSGSGRDRAGTIKITPTLLDVPLIEVMRGVAALLKQRDPALVESEPADAMLDRLRSQLTLDDVEDDGADDGDSSEPDDSEDVSELFLEPESHLEQFWLELQARITLLEELGTGYAEDHILGFTRDALAAYLKPVLLVDGQHRLAGALEATRAVLSAPAMTKRIRNLIKEGKDAAAVEDELWTETDRHLPVSLLMTEDAAEHVFQFVVVNQKAQPLTRALLGSIVATSLADEELEPIATRLRDAGIPLEESRAISFITREPDSPFAGVVKRGLEGQDPNGLEWNVLGTLVSVFRSLKGGRIWGEGIDHAFRWRRLKLADSPIVADYETAGYVDPYEYWSALDGVWRPCFMRFWWVVRNTLASDDPEDFNFWGNPRRSNIFNKVSLHILQADFFQYLADREVTLEDEDDVESLVEQWLTLVDTSYFSRDWQLSGVKRDTTGVRNQWAHLWVRHRKEGSRLPAAAQYSKPRSA